MEHLPPEPNHSASMALGFLDQPVSFFEVADERFTILASTREEVQR
jgi:hypothetical protein